MITPNDSGGAVAASDPRRESQLKFAVGDERYAERNIQRTERIIVKSSNRGIFCSEARRTPCGALAIVRLA
jgi:hypothetical protein